MRVSYILAFLILYEELSITKACKKLYITQQGLSKQVKAIEKELGITLFERTKSGLIPTRLGDKLYTYYKKMYNLYSESLGVIEKHKLEESRTLSVGFVLGLSNATDAKFLDGFQKENPDIQVNILEFSKEVCIEKLINSELDLAFLVNPFDKRCFESFPLARGKMYVAMHKTHYLAQEGDIVQFSKLNNEKIITGSPQNALRQLFDYYCELEHIKPNIVVSSAYSFTTVNTMMENKGVATLTSKMVKQITNKELVIKELETPVPGLMYCCILKNEEHSRETKIMIKYLKKLFNKPIEK